MNKALKLLFISLQFVVLIALLSMVYGFFAKDASPLAYIFTANFLAGTITIIVGLVLAFMPVFLKFTKLVDHTTFGSKYLDERTKKHEKAIEIICLGMLNILLTAVLQLALSLIL